jgi:predicted transcriptional regulator
MPVAKEEAIQLIQRLPDDATTEDILAQLYFKEQIERGLKDVAEGRVLTPSELRERIATWRK